MTTDTKNFEGHTAGPWSIGATQPDHIPVESETGIVFIARVEFHDGSRPKWNSDQTKYQAMANSSLIAAAPALLAERDRLREALEQIAAHNGVDWDWATTGNVARAALAQCGKGEK